MAVVGTAVQRSVQSSQRLAVGFALTQSQGQVPPAELEAGYCRILE
jgi:hypothetical protein